MDQIKEGMQLPRDYLHRTGYRLLTEAEWEYACRAGSSTSRFFGSSEELLSEYGWYTANTFNERPWPVGQLKPNDLGLFDVYGNVWEWGQDLYKQYGSEPVGSLHEDVDDTSLTVSKDHERPRRGGSLHLRGRLPSLFISEPLHPGRAQGQRGFSDRANNSVVTTGSRLRVLAPVSGWKRPKSNNLYEYSETRSG